MWAVPEKSRCLISSTVLSMGIGIGADPNESSFCTRGFGNITLIAPLHRSRSDLADMWGTIRLPPASIRSTRVNTLRTVFVAAVLAFIAGPTHSAIVTKELPYTVDGEPMIGYFAYDDRLAGPRPGVLVFHEWWGLNDFAKRQADALAAKGYRVLAADMYGRGVQTHDSAEAGSLAGTVRSKDLFRARAEGALEALMKQPNVDPARIGAVGYCFGGTTALELAYSGAPVKGVVSVHGVLTAPRETDQHIRSAVLVLTGAADPYVKREEIVAFQDRMERSGTEWTMITFGGAMHGFSNPEAGDHGMPGVAYDARIAERAWQDTLAFLARILGSARD